LVLAFTTNGSFVSSTYYAELSIADDCSEEQLISSLTGCKPAGELSTLGLVWGAGKARAHHSRLDDGSFKIAVVDGRIK
jgi:hypothetical protein